MSKYEKLAPLEAVCLEISETAKISARERIFMGYLDFDDEKENLITIRLALNRRNLFMDKDDQWDVPGPHPEMDYQVFIGRAYEQPPAVYTICTCKTTGYDSCKKHQNGIYVAIYPRAVYEIQSIEDWDKVRPDEKIAIGGRNGLNAGGSGTGQSIDS